MTPASDQPEIAFTLPRVTPTQRARAATLLAMLRASYPDAHCELNFSSPHELLAATILSAQTTDVNVNKATPALFERFPTPKHFADAQPAEIEPFVKSLGFFRNKAKSLHLSMKDIVQKHRGQVPRTMEQLLELHGVARKTANVVLWNAFGINAGVVVDTHVERLSVRFGLAKPGATVQVIERRLMALFPRECWGELSHLLIFHGRRACKARGATCGTHAICAQFATAACTNPRVDLSISAPSKGVRLSAGSVPSKRRPGARSSPDSQRSS